MRERGNQKEGWAFLLTSIFVLAWEKLLPVVAPGQLILVKIKGVFLLIKKQGSAFPGGPVFKNSPANARGRGSIPSPRRFYMPWGS